MLSKREDGYFRPTIAISNTDFDALEKFKELVKLGRISKPIDRTPQTKPIKAWRIESYRATTFLLQHIRQRLNLH